VNRLLKRGILKDDKRGVEGLPMKLIIISVIAVAALGVLWLWMPSGNDLADVEFEIIDGETPLVVGEEYDIMITARDDAGNRMEGVDIRLTGSGVHEGGTTDNDGEYTFNDISPEVSGRITVEAEKDGREASTTIMVL